MNPSMNVNPKTAVWLPWLVACGLSSVSVIVSYCQSGAAVFAGSAPLSGRCGTAPGCRLRASEQSLQSRTTASPPFGRHQLSGSVSCAVDLVPVSNAESLQILLGYIECGVRQVCQQPQSLAFQDAA